MIKQRKLTHGFFDEERTQRGSDACQPGQQEGQAEKFGFAKAGGEQDHEVAQDFYSRVDESVQVRISWKVVKLMYKFTMLIVFKRISNFKKSFYNKLLI